MRSLYHDFFEILSIYMLKKYLFLISNKLHYLLSGKLQTIYSKTKPNYCVFFVYKAIGSCVISVYNDINRWNSNKTKGIN